jgi:hypothetical protein
MTARTGGRRRRWGSSPSSFVNKKTKARSLVLYASFLCFCGTIVRLLFDCCSPSNGPVKTTTTKPQPNRQHPLYTTTARPCGADKPFWKNLNATHFRSQSGEDWHLLEYYFGFGGEHMGQLCGGTYVELGALDGVTISNSHVFHTQYDWRGVLIELAPDNYERLVVNRPAETELVPPIHAAVCHDDNDNAEEKEQHTQHRTVHYIAQKDKFWGTTSGIWEFMPPSFRAMWWQDVQWEDLVPIRCSPLRQLFKEYTPHVHFFDFLSLDVEGAELDALRSIDYAKTAFGVILVEADGHDQRKNLAVRLFLQRHGYVFVGEWGRSYWFVHPDFDTIYYNEQIVMMSTSSSSFSNSKYESDGNVAIVPAGQNAVTLGRIAAIALQQQHQNLRHGGLP